MGITFDGDADRALFADENGRVVNGDAVLLLAGRDLQARLAAWRREVKAFARRQGSGPSRGLRLSAPRRPDSRPQST